jgi:hypothetical protein
VTAELGIKDAFNTVDNASRTVFIYLPNEYRETGCSSTNIRRRRMASKAIYERI